MTTSLALTNAQKLDLTYPNVMSYIPTSEHQAIYAKTSTYDCTTAFQTLIDMGKPFIVPVGAKFRFNSALNWKSGAKLLCEGQEYYIGTHDAYQTILEFDSALTNTGIKMTAPSGKAIKDWAITGVCIQGYGAGRFMNFAGLRVVNGAGYGAMQFNLERVTFAYCRYGMYIDDAFFSGSINRVMFTYCIWGFLKMTTDYITSLSGDWGFFQTKFPIDITNATYISLNTFIDHCGQQADAMVQTSGLELYMPILVRLVNVQAVNFGYLGIENSKAMLFAIENYSTVTVDAMSYWQPTDQIWTSSSTIIANLPQSEQALFRLQNSCLNVRGLRMLWWTSAGYPAASTTAPNYFAQLLGGDGSSLSFIGSTIAAQSYCAHPINQAGLTIPKLQNGICAFGATNITPFNNNFDYTRGYMAVGEEASVTASSHTIIGPATYVEGTQALVIRGAPGASATIFKAVNGVTGNAANCSLVVPTAVSTSRSINAGGTVNTSGADYAEYENNNGLTIVKGQIVGFKNDGTLTLTYSEAVRFGVKSTNPSFVGGDNWQTGVEPEANASQEEKDAFYAQLEADRKFVDRVAYSGKVPVNVTGAVPGQYVIAKSDENGYIVGEAIASPSFEQYLKVVGRVNSILPDGRAQVAIIVH